ncbi:MAG: hypothetical protein OXC00_13280 [Acidimicrobiaceae bacterium]|nr:hypothetical protein [Acidimicrobiaceae bacterium]
MDTAPLDDRAPAGSGDGGDGAERPSLPAATGLIAILAALIVGLWVLSLTGGSNGVDGRDADPVDEDRFIAPTTTTTLREAEALAEVASEAEAPQDATPVQPFSDLEGRLAFLSGRHVALLDLATGVVRRVPIEPFGSIPEFTGLDLITDGKRTVGLSLTEDPPTAVLIATGAALAPSSQPLVDFWVISQPDGPGGAVRLNAWQNYGVLTGDLRAPSGSDVVVARDVGVLIASPVGRTFRPTFSGFEIVSEHRLLAASSDLRVEQRCDERLNCTVLAVNAATGGTTVLPEEFIAEIATVHVSPDSRWVLNNTSPAWLFDRRTEELSLLDGGGYGRPQWSDDSAWIAWMTSDRTPTLAVARLEPPEGSQDWLVVELAGLGADPSPGSSFLLDASFNPQ